MSNATHCYVGIWPACDCIRFVTADEPEYAKDNAKEIARLIRAGYSVERLTVKEFKEEHRFGCKDELQCPNPHAKRKKGRK